MSKPDTCSKCGSKDLASIVSPNGRLGANVVMTGIFSFVKVTRYVCLSCGFTEEWIHGRPQLEKLRAAARKSAGG